MWGCLRRRDQMGRGSALLLKGGAAAPAGDGDLTLAPGDPELLAAVGTLEVAVLLVLADGAAQPVPFQERAHRL